MDLSRLSRSGWTQVPDITDDEALINLARRLGDIGKRPIDILTPKSTTEAAHRRFSAKYGLCEFPMHTDTAYWPLPARYILMRSERDSTVPTLILESEFLDKFMLKIKKAIFSIQTTRGSFYGRAIFKHEREYGIRFDPISMKPANISAEKTFTDLINGSQKSMYHHVWKSDSALIIDNWKCLHGRSCIPASEENRQLSRIYVGGIS